MGTARVAVTGQAYTAPAARPPTRPRLEAVLVDPLTDAAPAGWDEFVEAQRISPVWHSPLVGAVDWCTPTPSTLALIRESSSETPVALFHARHLGPARPGRFARPGRLPMVGLTDCRISPGVTPGFRFAAELDHADRREACRAFERALARRAGRGHPALAYRNLREHHLAMVPARGRTRIRMGPDMVIENAWPDLSSYLDSLPRKWRWQLRRIHAEIQDAGLRVAVEEAVDPDEVSWLTEVVRRRYRSRGLLRPPWPARFFAELGRIPGGRFLTYREPAGRLIGCTTLVDTGQELVPVTWGTRGVRDGPYRNLYFDQYVRLVELMIQEGRERLALGFAINTIKARYGAHPQPRWTVLGRR